MIILPAALVVAIIAAAVIFWPRPPTADAEILGYTTAGGPSITVRANINTGDTIVKTTADEEADRITVSVLVRPAEGPGTHVPRPRDITIDLDAPVAGRTVIAASTGQEILQLKG